MNNKNNKSNEMKIKSKSSTYSKVDVNEILNKINNFLTLEHPIQMSLFIFIQIKNHIIYLQNYIQAMNYTIEL